MSRINKLSSSSSSEDFEDCFSTLNLTSTKNTSESNTKTSTTIESENLSSRKNNLIANEISQSMFKDSKEQYCSEETLSQFKESRKKMDDDEEINQETEENKSKTADVNSHLLEDEEIEGVESSHTEIDDEFDEETMRLNEQSLSTEELEANKNKALDLKEEANKLFRAEKIEESIEMYTNALKISPLQYTKERAILYGNRAAAKMKYDAKKSALSDCTKALELWPQYVRVLLRRAKLYEMEDKLDEALEDYKRVYELDPGQSDAREAMVRLPPMINERNERLKTEMMGKLKELGNMFLKPFGLSTNNFQMEQNPETGSYSLNFKQNSS